MNSLGLALLKLLEGLVLKPYKDVSGTPTIGYGNTFYSDGTPVKMTDKPITETQASALFKTIVNNFTKRVNGLVTSNVNENQKSALISFAYNVGIQAFKESTLLKRVNSNPNDPDIEVQFKRWNQSKGKVIQGLVNRRQKEWDLYNTPVNQIKKHLLPLILFFFSVLALSL